MYLGTTPVTAEGVVPGTHRLNVSVEGYEGIAETIEVAPGPTDIEIKKAPNGGYTMRAWYRAEAPFVANVSLAADFDKTVDVKGR